MSKYGLSIQSYRKGRLFSFTFYLAFVLSAPAQLALAQINPFSEAMAAAESLTEEEAVTTPESRQTPLAPLIVEPQPPCAFNPDAAPEMVLLQGGYFHMGSAEGSEYADPDEYPQHWVAIQPFALGRCEVTVSQFRQFIEDTGYVTTAEEAGTENQSTANQSTANQSTENPEKALNAAIQNPTDSQPADQGCFSLRSGDLTLDSNASWRNPGFEQTAQHPVTCISWRDSKEYVRWLSARTGLDYRLPTEAEWEYAARADFGGLFAFGDNADTGIVCGFANIYTGSLTSNCTDIFEYTAPVGQFPPNGFGLYDMHGNILEWTEDCWHENYQNAPVDGSAWLQEDAGNCERRVLRGGSWGYEPLDARSANRGRFNLGDTYSVVGFRIARTL